VISFHALDMYLCHMLVRILVHQILELMLKQEGKILNVRK